MEGEYFDEACDIVKVGDSCRCCETICTVTYHRVVAFLLLIVLRERNAGEVGIFIVNKAGGGETLGSEESLTVCEGSASLVYGVDSCEAFVVNELGSLINSCGESRNINGILAYGNNLVCSGISYGTSAADTEPDSIVHVSVAVCCETEYVAVIIVHLLVAVYIVLCSVHHAEHNIDCPLAVLDCLIEVDICLACCEKSLVNSHVEVEHPGCIIADEVPGTGKLEDSVYTVIIYIVCVDEALIKPVVCKIDIKLCKVYKVCICSAERVLILCKVNSVLTCLDISGDKAVTCSVIIALDFFYLAVVEGLNSLCSWKPL